MITAAVPLADRAGRPRPAPVCGCLGSALSIANGVLGAVLVASST